MDNNVKFFYDNAPTSFDPKVETWEHAKVRGAQEYATAERAARTTGHSFQWENDPLGCMGCSCGACKCCRRIPHATFQCRMLNGEGMVVGSLGGICGPTAEYRRMVEAELALEYCTV